MVHSAAAAESVANVGSEQAGGGTVGEGDPIRLERSDGAAGGGGVVQAAEIE